ncbi:MAG: ABC transporter ATP-binding protein/permease [Erysipelotrichaceae bacterium]|nr:ABC transporter ATP-binding protein/permease [Erysipelotrichaceae bacterium]
MIAILIDKIGEYKKETILTPLFMVGEVLLETLIPTIMAMLIDEMTGESLDPVIRYGTMLLVLAMLSLFCGAMSARFGAKASTGFAKNLRRDMFYHVQDFSFEDIDKFSSSSLVTRLTNDVSQIQMAFQMLIRMAVRTPLQLIFSVIMAFRINHRMSLIFLGIIPVLGIGLYLIFQTAHPIFRRIFKKYDALNNSVQENVAGIRVVKSFVREDYEIEKFNRASEEVRSDFTRAERILALNNPLQMLCIKTAKELICYFGALMIIDSVGTKLTTGQLSSLISYGVAILVSMMMLSMVFIQITFSAEAANRICEVLTHMPSLSSPMNGVKEVKDGSIVFDHVSFRYDPHSKRNALTDIDLDIRSGQTIGILGSTGSSKTTLIQLINRLYDVSEGAVYVGGVDVKDYDLVSLRDAVSVVLQKNVLFSGTIRENLRWGNKEASDEEIERVCKLAQADEFIQQMPDKYDTVLTQGATNVSGGQKQRLCIARVLLKKPKILILDDSTSAVDTRTDALIRKAFREEIPDTTKIIIAQRVSSIEDSDQIIVLDSGKIVEHGDHNELMKLNGIYAEIYESQTKGKEED